LARDTQASYERKGNSKPMRDSPVAVFQACTLLLLLAIGTATQSRVLAQSAADSSTQATQKMPAYEVISITPNKSDAQKSGWRSSPDGIVLTNAPLTWLIRSAFGIISDDQFSGLPAWVDSDRFDIQAKMDPETAAAWKAGSRQQKVQLQRQLLQSLFADRCRLKFHHETKQLPVYDLVIAKSGLKMKEVTSTGGGRVWMGDGQFGADAGTMEDLIFSLSDEVGRVIIDKTGLGEKKFEIKVKWAPDEQQGSADAGPGLFPALEEQLGLKLVASHGPVDTVVIDSIEKPSSN
jgi:uncharacterized protein (TIGR03435 family)